MIFQDWKLKYVATILYFPFQKWQFYIQKQSKFKKIKSLTIALL